MLKDVRCTVISLNSIGKIFKLDLAKLVVLNAQSGTRLPCLKGSKRVG